VVLRIRHVAAISILLSSVFATAAATVMADSVSGTSGQGKRGAPAGQLAVYVVDEAGAPVAGAEVTGEVEVNRGPSASFCCSTESLGHTTTGADGRALIRSPPFTFRPVTITASRPGWPARAVSPALRIPGGEPRVTIVLGPLRPVAGRIEVGGDCPASFLQVRASPLDVKVPVDRDGRFAFAALPFWAHLDVSACGRHAGVALEGHGHGGPVILTVPAAGRRAHDYETPLAAPPRRGPSRRTIVGWPSPASVAPPSRIEVVPSCIPSSKELVVAGSFERVELEPSCRFFLAASSADRRGSGAASWTLVRPDGSTLALGETYLGRRPSIGTAVSLVERSADEIEIVDLATGQRQVERKVQGSAMGAGDAVVLAVPAPRVGSFEAVNLDIVARAGRRRVATGAGSYWTIGDHGAGGRALVYSLRKKGSDDQEVHAFELVAGTDHLIAADASSWRVWPREGGAGGGQSVFVQAADRLSLYDLASGASELVASAAAGWRLLGDNLLLKTADDNSGTLWTPAGLRALQFRWPHFPSCADVRPARISAEYLMFQCENNAVLVSARTGASRILAEGVRGPISEGIVPPIAGDWLAVEELWGRTLIVSFSGQPARAVGRGAPRWFSPDRRWLAIDGAMDEPPEHVTLAAIDNPALNISLDARGGSWAPDAQIFFYTGTKGGDGPLYAALPDEGRTITVEPRARSFRILRGGEVLVVVPPGGPRPAGVWRRRVSAPSAN
jgi:hypothetical protein